MTAAVILLSLLAIAALGYAWVQRREARTARAERDQARAAEADARLAAERAVLARESFFDLATHELRSPLAAILGYQELIQDGAYGPLDAAAEPIDRIGRSAHHLLHLIEGVVELSRIRGGSLEPDIEPVNLHVLFSGLAETFRTRAEERNIEAVVRMPDAFPTARTDLDRLKRALDLVITSAVKHPAGDTVRMDISLADGDDTVAVAIRGTAIQVRDDDDPALRLGIRLAVAAGVARILGGDLDLDTDEDGLIRGLVFHIATRSQDPDQGFDDGGRRG